MTLIETVAAISLFAVTAGSVLDIWYQAAHGVREVLLQQEVDDLADYYAEQAASGQLSGMGSPTSFEVVTSGAVYVVSVAATTGGGEEVVVTSKGRSQTLQVGFGR